MMKLVSQPTIEDLLKFLRDKADMLERLSMSHRHHSTTNDKVQPFSHKVHCNLITEKTSNQNYTENKSQFNKSRNYNNRLCLLCNGPHPLYSCQKFIDYSILDRQKFIKDKGVCENCFRPRHTSVECRYGPCRKCDKKHNSLICDLAVNMSCDSPRMSTAAVDSADDVPQDHTDQPSNTYTQSYTIQVHNAHSNNYDSSCPPQSVLLSTALVYVPDHLGNLHKARALLDSGSERTFVSKSFSNRIKAPSIQSTQVIQGVNNIVTQSTQVCDLELRSIDGTWKSRVQSLILPKLSFKSPNISLTSKPFKIPINIRLADPTFFESQPIDILIGADLFWDLIIVGKINLKNGPVLQNTKLGWIVSGSVHNYTQNLKDTANITQTETI